MQKFKIQNQNKFKFLSENIISFKKKAYVSDFPQPELWSDYNTSKRRAICQDYGFLSGQKSPFVVAESFKLQSTYSLKNVGKKIRENEVPMAADSLENLTKIQF